MLLLDRQNDATSPARAGADRIQLRMRPDGQLFDLARGKTTIGSSPRCNVRIEQPGVQPLHCLIVQSAEGLRLRSWATNARLNGAPFVEAALTPGDCFSVGPVEFEVVEQTSESPKRDASEEPASTPNDWSDIRAGRDLARSRARRLLEAMRRERAVYRELETQVADLQEAVLQGIEEGNSIARDLEGANEGLASAQQKLAESESAAGERDQLAKQNEVLSTEAARLRDEICGLVRERDRNAEEHQKLAFDCAALREQHRSLSVENYQRINEEDSRLEQLEARLAEVTEENSCLAAEKACLAQEQAELRSEVGRLAEIERELSAAIEAKNSTADELQRALLQIAKLQDWETRAQEILANNEALREEHDRLIREIAELRELPNARSDERERIDDAWQALTAETARLSESREELALENAKLRDALVEVERQLTASQETQVNGAEAVAVERQRLAAEADATIAAAVAEMERRLEDQARDYTESIEAVREELAAALEAQHSLELAREDWQRQLAAAAESAEEQSKRVSALEAHLAAVQLLNRPAVQGEKCEAAAISGHGDIELEAKQFSSPTPVENVHDHEMNAPISIVETGSQNSFASGEQPGTCEDVSDSSVVLAWRPLSNPGAEVDSAESAFGESSERRVEEVAPVKAPEPTSFIERYAHMFADDDGTSGSQPAIANPQPEGPQSTSATPGFSSASSHSFRSNAGSAKDDEEESIEQYMAKLLERVRGDSGPSSTFVPAPSAPLNAPPAACDEDATVSPAPLPAVEVAAASAPQVAREVTKRKSVAPEVGRDLGALRALANATARRAISQSELKKHRRNAVTKVIVSTLAGVTSLWLMLDSPDFKDIQFITACVSLVVAAIWAGETFRTLLESFRAAAYDGPEVEAVDVDEAGLPIDLETYGSM